MFAPALVAVVAITTILTFDTNRINGRRICEAVKQTQIGAGSATLIMASLHMAMFGFDAVALGYHLMLGIATFVIMEKLMYWIVIVVENPFNR